MCRRRRQPRNTPWRIFLSGFDRMRRGGRRIEPSVHEQSRIVAFLDSQSPVQSVLAAFRNVAAAPCSGGLSWQRKIAHNELYAIADTETEYGTMCETKQLMGANGPLAIYHVNPFAMLSHAVAVSTLFAAFLYHIVDTTPRGVLFLFRQRHTWQPKTARHW